MKIKKQKFWISTSIILNMIFFGVLIGGEPKLAFPNSSLWVFSKHLNEIQEEQSKDYYYYNMLGINIPLDEIGGRGGIILFKKKLKTR
ncbi:MAG: hypothetical protein ACFFG0_15460 [Candidatus Thorarchaeota archaeon]